MTPGDNILYFEGNRGRIDFRLCPKNAQTTLTHLWAYANFEELQHYKKHHPKICSTLLRREWKRYRGNAANWRRKLAVKRQYNFDPPFRFESFKVAVKRDPVERFVSACNTIRKWTRDESQPLYRLRPPIDIENFNVDDLIELIYSGKWSNEHFFSQSYFLGQYDKYDAVIDIDEISSFFKEHMILDHTKLDVNTVKSNRSVYKTELTSDQKTAIRQLYKLDYENGFY